MNPDGANGMSLLAAQANYQQFGAIAEDVGARVRPARPEEPLDEDWRPLDVSKDWFESNPPPGHDAFWPPDLASLYWWRPTYWNGIRSEQPVQYRPDLPAEALVLQLREEIPQTRDVIERLERRYGQPAPFAVCSHLTDWVIERYCAGESKIADRVVDVLNSALLGRGDYAQRCVASGFLASEAWYSRGVDAFTEEWPSPIGAEFQRQSMWRAHVLAAAPKNAWSWRWRRLLGRVRRRRGDSR